MAILDARGTIINTGSIISMAVLEGGNKAVLVSGTIVDGIQVDNGQRYFHVNDTTHPTAPWRKAVITGGTSSTTGVTLNAVKSA